MNAQQTTASNPLADMIATANGRSTQRTLDPVTAALAAHAAYALGVSRCEALGLPYSCIRVEVTGGERLATNYKYRADMTVIRFDGKEWSASRCANKAPLVRGTSFLMVRAEGDALALKAKLKAAGLKSRVEHLSEDQGEAATERYRAVEYLCAFSAE